MIGLLLRVASLTAIYATALGSLHPLDLLAGAAVATLVLVGLRSFLLPRSRSSSAQTLARVAAFPRFAGAVAADIVAGTVAVSLVVLGRHPLHAPGLVEIPIGERTPAGLAASALATTLSPGEVLVDVDWDRRVWIVHVLDASDPAAVRVKHERMYERHQKAVFP